MFKLYGKHLAALAMITTLPFSLSTSADDFDPVREKLKTAMAAEIRGEGDTARDKNRKPIGSSLNMLYPATAVKLRTSYGSGPFIW